MEEQLIRSIVYVLVECRFLADLKNIYNAQETQLSAKSEITDHSAMPRKQRTVAIFAAMVTRKHRQGRADITVKELHIHGCHDITDTILTELYYTGYSSALLEVNSVAL